MAPTIACSEKEVCYVPSVWLPHFTNEDHLQAHEALSRHQWTTFMSTEPSFFLTSLVNQFYESLAVDAASGDYVAHIKVFTSADLKESEDF